MNQVIFLFIPVALVKRQQVNKALFLSYLLCIIKQWDRAMPLPPSNSVLVILGRVMNYRVKEKSFLLLSSVVGYKL